MKLSFERNPERSRQSATLPAYFYNTLKVVFASVSDEAVFIPIRNLQFLAIVDRAEVVFVDRHHSRFVEIAWQHFRPDKRDSIDDPVAYDQVVYEQLDRTVAARLPGEFFLALKAYREKNLQLPDGEADVIPLQPKSND